MRSSGFGWFLVACMSALAMVSPRAVEAQSQGASAAAATPPPNVTQRLLHATRRTGPVVVDGLLDEAAWRGASTATGFVQQSPDVGAPASQPTEARVIFDAAAMYVAMRLRDARPDSVVAPLGRRDNEQYSDWAMVLVDSYLDRRTAFRFMVNPSGVQRDAVTMGDQEWNEDAGWDAVWSAAARVDSLGWTAEFRIPFSQLRFSTSSDGTTRWGLEFGRHLARRNERSYWAPVDPARNTFASQFGTVDGIAASDAPRRLELVPYSLASVTRRPGGDDPLVERAAHRQTMGLDLRAGLTPNATLTATINPDFGQVEADPSEVNLTGIETFFPERRPFFLDGGSLFAFNLSSTDWISGSEELVYTRRIGRAPQLAAPDDAMYEESGPPARILGAAKISARTPSGWTLGALSALTDAMHARFQRGDGGVGRYLAEPRTHYGVVRLSRDFESGESSLGAVATSVHRWGVGSSLPSDATVVGLDGRRRWSNGQYVASANLLASELRGSAEAISDVARRVGHLYQRPDASYLDVDPRATALRGVMSEVRLTRQSGRGLRWGLVGKAVTPGFDVNDLGIQPTADLIEGVGWVGLPHFTPGRLTRSWETWLNVWSGWTFGGERRLQGQSLFARASLHNYWEVQTGLEHSAPILSVEALRGGPALRQPERWGGNVRLTSDPRRTLRATAEVRGSRNVGGGGYRVTVTPQVSARLGGRAQLQLAPSVTRWVNPEQYVDAADTPTGTRYVVGAVRQTSAALTVRADYSFGSRLTLQLYAQPFVSAGEYASFGEVASARSPSLAARRRVLGPEALTYEGDVAHVATADGSYSFERPDYRAAELTSNAVLRWEYAPGSSLFVVWGHGRSTDGDPRPFDLRAQAGDLFRSPATNVLQVKLSHWLGR